jgi:hypothetical protein
MKLPCRAIESIGRTEFVLSPLGRRRVLECLLSHPHRLVVYSAARGLAYLDDPAALPALRVASDHGNQNLRRQLDGVIVQLASTKRGTT